MRFAQPPIPASHDSLRKGMITNIPDGHKRRLAELDPVA